MTLFYENAVFNVLFSVVDRRRRMEFDVRELRRRRQMLRFGPDAAETVSRKAQKVLRIGFENGCRFVML